MGTVLPSCQTARFRRAHYICAWRVLPVAAVLAVAVAAGAGCGDKHKAGPSLRRSGDAGAAVVVVDRTADGVAFADEVEPNDSCEKATALTLPGGVHGSLASEDDADYFKVDPGEAKNLAVMLSGIDDVDLMIEALDGDGKVIATSDRGPKKIVEGLPTFAAEGPACFVVREYISRRRRKDSRREKRTAPSPTYALTVSPITDPPAGSEIEPNEDSEHAPEVLLGDEVTGFIGHSGDVDLWKLSLAGFAPAGADPAAAAVYSLDIDVAGVPGVTLTLDVLDESGAVVLSRTGEKSGDLALRNLVPAAGQKQYFARLHGKRSNPEERYRLRVKSRLLESAAETEPNDSAEAAVPLRIDPAATEGERTGYLGPGDVDAYVLAGAGGRLVNLAAEPGTGGDVAVQIVVGGIPTQANMGAAGTTEKLTGIVIPAGEDPIITVTRAGKSDDGVSYRLRWSIL